MSKPATECGKVAAVPDAEVISAGTARPGAGNPVAATQRMRGWLTVAVPAAAALLLGGYQLGKLSLWRDEAYSLEAASRSFGQIFALLHHADAVNGTYYLLLHLSIGLLGTSEAALRLPSLLAITVAAATVAALGRLLARLAGLPAPELTGLLAGLLFAVAPQATRYAQDARAYAIVTLLVTVASYLLVRAMLAGTWRWWAGYAAAIALAAFFNLFSLLVVLAHGVTVLLARRERRWRWLVAAVAAGVVTAPLAALGFKQRGQISWLTKPGLRTVDSLFSTFAGTKPLIIPIAALALAGCVAGLAARARPPGAAVPGLLVIVTLPWLILPPVVLLAVSRFKPAYDVRYVFYCQPALALLCAAGLAWLARAVMQVQPGGRGRALGVIASGAVALLVAVLLIAPQRAVRQPASRPDNLRYLAQIVAAHERPADAVFYIPWNMRSLGMGYPAAFRRLRDISLRVSPVASNTLLGGEVSLATISGRLPSVRRAWLVTAVSQQQLAAVTDHVQRAELAFLDGMRLIGQWHAGQDVLSLYSR
jgi:mannosyltransferase